MDWDNLRYFLELARAGTLVGAARRLAVDHTTVARRLQALEKQVGSALFAREAGGHRLTEAGRQLLPAVEAMETAVLGVERAGIDAAGRFQKGQEGEGVFTELGVFLCGVEAQRGGGRGRDLARGVLQFGQPEQGARNVVFGKTEGVEFAGEGFGLRLIGEIGVVFEEVNKNVDHRCCRENHQASPSVMERRRSTG